MSAVTIRDMSRIVEKHGLVPVPLDLDPSTMSPSAETVRRAITPKTRAIVVAHLFGTILDLDAIAAICTEHNILFIEDCAQAFDGLRYTGHSAADVVMFSFGPIKTATALAGGLLVVRDAALLRRMRMTQKVWPFQSHSEFRARVRTFSLLKMVSGRFAFSCLVRVLGWLGKDLDATLNGTIRNFPVDRFFDSLRRQPSYALLKLIARRISTFDVARQDRRSHIGRMLATSIQQYQTADSNDTLQPFVPSACVPRHTWWVFPLCSTEAAAVIATLRSAGFDATQGSQLQPIATPAGFQQHHPALATSVVNTMLFLPLYPELTDFAVNQLSIAIASSGRSAR